MFLLDLQPLPSSTNITPEGFIELTGNLARVGVMPYAGKELGKDGGKVYKLYRSPELIKRVAEQLKNKPITVGHPKNGVSIENSDKEYSGTITETWFDEATGWAKGKILLTHKKAIEAFLNGFNQLSVGAKDAVLKDYEGEWVDELGTVEKGRKESYDVVVDDLVGNHVALVEKARAGNKATFDSGENVGINISNVGFKGITMDKKFTINLFDGSSVELSGDNAKDIFKTFETLNKENKELTTKVAKLSDSVSELDGLTAKVAELTKQLDSANGELEATKVKLNDSANTAISADDRKAWLQTYAEVKPILNDDGDTIFGLSVADLKRQAVKVSKGIDLADKSDDYVDAFYAGLQLSVKADSKSDSGKSSQSKELLDGTKDDSVTSWTDHFAEYNKRVSGNAYAIFGGK